MENEYRLFSERVFQQLEVKVKRDIKLYFRRWRRIKREKSVNSILLLS